MVYNGSHIWAQQLAKGNSTLLQNMPIKNEYKTGKNKLQKTRQGNGHKKIHGTKEYR